MGDAVIEKRRFSDLAHPPSWPLVGSLPYFDPPRVHLVFEEWARRYGTPFRVHLGKRWMMVIDDPTEIGRILRARPGAFRRVRPVESIFRELGIAGLFSSEGADWERQRRLVMRAFDPAHLKRYFPGLVVVTRRLLARFRRAALRGDVLDLQQEYMRYTVDVTAGLAFGADINTIEQGDNVIQKHLDKVFPSINRRMAAMFPWWRYVKLPADRVLERDLAEVRKAIDGFIAAARARMDAAPALKANPSNLIEALLAARDTPASGFSENDVSGNVFTALLAGEDTTANTLAWLSYFLAEEPHAQAAAREEADRVLGAREVIDTLEDVDALAYIAAATREAMRLKPVAPFLSHESIEPVTVCGIDLRARTPVATLMRAAGLNPDLFPEPLAFKPERWTSDTRAAERESAAKRVLMPFGGGPRFCPGRYLALLEIQMVAAMLMKNFRIERVGDSPVRERNALSMLPEGFFARLHPR
jgi:cytochrome P450